MKKSLNLKWKFVIYLLLFTFGVLALIFSFQVLFLQDFYTNSKINDLNTVSKNISGRLNIEDRDLFIEYMAEQARDYDVCVRVISTTNDGTKSYSIDDLKACNLTKLTNVDIYDLMVSTISNGGTLLIEENVDNIVPNYLVKIGRAHV